MALFTTPQEERSRPATPRGEPSLSIIAAGMRVEGELRTDGVVKIEGTVVGSVRAEQQVLVAKGGIHGLGYNDDAIVRIRLCVYLPCACYRSLNRDQVIILFTMPLDMLRFVDL